MIIDIVRSNFKIIIFGFVFTFFSSIGQSFFIGLFNSNIRDELNITHGEFGAIYAVATLCSSLMLIWLGKKIDDLKLVNYSILVIGLLFFATLFFSFINGIIFLLIGIFFLRLSGQGLMAHTASTAVSRYFEKRRGKALSYIWLGMSLGEFLLPVLMVYLVSFILSLFGGGIPFIHSSGLIGIIFSLFVVGIASLNLVLDFDFIEQGAEDGAPRYMEWYAAFGLMVTLIWLYIEIVRLLVKLRSRD